MVDKRYMKALFNSLFKPKRGFNFLVYKSQASKRLSRIRYLPHVLDIEPTTACNFRCQMCQVASEGFESSHMDLSLFEKILDDNPQLFKIKLQGMGEPFLCPQIFEMIQYAARKKILVEVITNGSLFNETNIQKIVHSGLTKLTVSMDGAAKETFEKIRKGSDFSAVVNGTRNLASELREKNNRIVLDAWTVVQKDNVHEAEEIVQLSKEIGFASITFQVQLSGWGKPDWEDRNKKYEIAMTQEILAKGLQRALELGKKIKLPTRLYTGGIYNYHNPCRWPWHSAYIDCNGAVVPCCIIADSRVVSFGSMQESNIEGIWNSRDYLAFRKRIKDNDIPSFCRNCYQEYREERPGKRIQERVK